MDIELTRKQFWIVSISLGFILFIISMTVNMIGLYYSDEIKIGCSNGTIYIYNKSDLNKLDTICGDENIYKYNDNSGLGAYFPKKRKVINNNLNINQSIIIK